MSINQDTQQDNSLIRARKQTEEYKRLQEARNGEKCWKKWGPYLSDRQWATVREDYSEDGNAWGYFGYDQARSRAYRWGEDGIFGISDDRQLLCFALTLWNGEDDHLKERFFGLTGLGSWPNEGNHMEDVKEYYFYLDNTPTHSYMKALYKYPYKYPYDELTKENNTRSKEDPEYELIDTGCFDAGYFDVLIEYAKNSPEDILIKITVWNQGTKAHKLHILPTLWFRNTWSWAKDAKAEKDKLHLEALPEPIENNAVILAHHEDLGEYYLYCQNEIPLLFTDNENNEYLLNSPNHSPYVKDGINNCVVGQQIKQVNPLQRGTKASAHYIFTLLPKKPKEIWLRLTNISPSTISEPFGSDFEKVFEDRKREADKFYEVITPFFVDKEKEEKQKQMKQLQRQAFAGMLWNKQFYYYIVKDWLNGDTNGQSEQIYPPYELTEEIKAQRSSVRNQNWQHLSNQDIISMPDKWEYPYYCVWDSAFHAITFALIDPDFAREQLKLFTQSPDYMNEHNGQIPSCEFDFSQIHPPNIAWAALKIYEIEEEMYGSSSLQFLVSIFENLQPNLKWWYDNNKCNKLGTIESKYLFQAGFLGLDNICIVDRNQFMNNDTVKIEQVDATSWAAIFYLNMLKIGTMTMLNLQGQQKFEKHKEKVKDFLKKFILIVHEINEIVNEHQASLWDKKDNFFYEVFKISLEKFSLELPLKYRSCLGFIPIVAVEIFKATEPNNLTEILRENISELFGLPREQFEYLLGEEEYIDIRKPGEEDENQELDMFLSIVNKPKLYHLLDKMLDEPEFLSHYGIRSLSKFHEEHPYQLDGKINIAWRPGDVQTFPIEMKYEPAETKVPVHSTNSNWRGPIWFPINFLLIESFKKFHEYFNVCLHEENFKVLCPSVSHHRISLQEVAIEISERLINIFLTTTEGKRAVYGNNPKIYDLFKDPGTGEQDLILFYEYFNGDTGQGLGASHQTGWTGLVANLIHQVIKYEYEKTVAEKEQDQVIP
ncbi:MAG: glucosidase [Gloeocapsa sp. DLM2.Bin57]|nr:MAG: glucosidase [Gloeocapsa sp. DLM2.Bin57]